MPVLAPSFPAPHIDSTAQSCSEETSNSVSIMAHPESPPENTVSRIPRVILDVESITNTLAAQLATSLLGHVLFLKSQIPLYDIPDFLYAVLINPFAVLCFNCIEFQWQRYVVHLFHSLSYEG